MLCRNHEITYDVHAWCHINTKKGTKMQTSFMNALRHGQKERNAVRFRDGRSLRL